MNPVLKRRGKNWNWDGRTSVIKGGPDAARGGDKEGNQRAGFVRSIDREMIRIAGSTPMGHKRGLAGLDLGSLSDPN